VDTPPQLNSADIPRAYEGSDQNDLFLRGVYSSIKYPAYAREYGVPTVIGVTYLVDAGGETSIEKTSIFTPEEATKLHVPKEEFITITSQVTCVLRPNGSLPTAVTPPPSQVISEQRLAKANTVLEEAAAASILALPSFLPGSHLGDPVVVRFSRFFSFRTL